MDRGLGPASSGRRTSLGRASTSVGTGSERCREGEPHRPPGVVGAVIARFSLGSGSTEVACRACLLWLGSRPSGRLSNAVDCLQCSATAAGRWGGDLVLCP